MNHAHVKVWDLFVRVFHWSLVVLFALAYVTGDEENWVHNWAGYAILALIAARLVWGLVGTRHARFSDFLRSPAAAVRYLRDLAAGSARRHLGHNPAAAWMIVALLASVLATGASGLVVLGLEGHGPLAQRLDASSWVVGVAAPLAEPDDEAAAYDDDAGDDADEAKNSRLEAAEDVWEELHEFLANFTVFLIVLHVLGVLLSSLAHRENLVRAMIDGRKRAS